MAGGSMNASHIKTKVLVAENSLEFPAIWCREQPSENVCLINCHIFLVNQISGILLSQVMIFQGNKM